MKSLSIYWCKLITCLAMLVIAMPALSAQPLAAVEPAARTVTLSDLIDDAVRRNPGVQAKRRAYEAARARVLASWLPDDPEFGVDVEGQPSLFHLSDRTDREYMLVQTIPFPTTLWLKRTAALRDADIAFERWKEEERQVVWHLEQPYAELFLTDRTQRALEEVGALLERLARTVQSRYETNQASQQDLLKVQIESSKLAIERFDWQQKSHLAAAHIAHLLSQPLENRYVPTEQPEAALTLSLPELEQLALRERPELRAAELGIKRARVGRWLQRTSWLPQLVGRLEARQYPGDGNIQQYDTFIGATVPVWSIVKGLGGEWRAASHDVGEAEGMYDEMKNEVRLAVHAAYAKAQSADYAVREYELAILPKAKQQVEVAMASYEAGRIDFLALIDAQRMLKDSQMAYYRVKGDQQIGLADLRLAVGAPWPVSTTPKPSGGGS